MNYLIVYKALKSFGISSSHKISISELKLYSTSVQQ